MAKHSSDLENYENRQMFLVVGAVAVVLLIVIIFFVVKAFKTGSASVSDTGSSPAPAALVTKVTSIPDTIFATVGTGTVSGVPSLIKAPALTSNNKPSIVYIGAEYCPYCAAERWPMVVALSRFGTFANLAVSHSSSTDVYPSTETFSFHGSTYTSDYVNFNATETQSNVPSGSGYVNLDTPSTDDQNLLNTYDNAPYVSAQAAGGIPFVDFGGKYLITGATYSPSVLQGKTADEIASAFSNASDPITTGVIGAANTITAAICSLTNNQPSNVCTPAVQSLETQLNAQTAAGSTTK